MVNVYLELSFTTKLEEFTYKSNSNLILVLFLFKEKRDSFTTRIYFIC